MAWAMPEPFCCVPVVEPVVRWWLLVGKILASCAKRFLSGWYRQLRQMLSVCQDSRQTADAGSDKIPIPPIGPGKSKLGCSQALSWPHNVPYCLSIFQISLSSTVTKATNNHLFLNKLSNTSCE
jgi:hypothetical protein